MLKITGLTKTYAGGIQALSGVDLEILPGVFGLLGPNGAGKTTLMKILATLLEPDSGAAEMNGIDLINDQHGTRKMLGYLPQEFGLYPTFTAEQMLDYFAKLKGVMDRKEAPALVDALLDRVNLSCPEAKTRRILGRNAATSGNSAGAYRPAPTYHCRRANRRTGSRRANSLSQPAGGNRERKCGGHSFNSYCFRRLESLQPNGDHSARRDPRLSHAAASSQ